MTHRALEWRSPDGWTRICYWTRGCGITAIAAVLIRPIHPPDCQTWTCRGSVLDTQTFDNLEEAEQAVERELAYELLTT